MLESEESSKESHEETEEKAMAVKQAEGTQSESRGACGTFADERSGKPVTSKSRE